MMMKQGLYYLKSRYYDPVTGRFLNADDTSILLMTSNISRNNNEVPSLGMSNLFAYCENNPIKYTDPDGYVTPANVIGAVIGGIIGAVGGYFLTNWLANKLNLSGWKRNLFVWGLTAVITAAAAVIGYFIGPYVTKPSIYFMPIDPVIVSPQISFSVSNVFLVGNPAFIL